MQTGSKRFYFVLLSGLLVTAQLSTAFSQVRWSGSVLRQDADWYASAEVRKAADTLLSIPV